MILIWRHIVLECDLSPRSNVSQCLNVIGQSSRPCSHSSTPPREDGATRALCDALRGGGARPTLKSDQYSTISGKTNVSTLNFSWLLRGYGRGGGCGTTTSPFSTVWSCLFHFEACVSRNHRLCEVATKWDESFSYPHLRHESPHGRIYYKRYYFARNPMHIVLPRANTFKSYVYSNDAIFRDKIFIFLLSLKI